MATTVEDIVNFWRVIGGEQNNLEIATTCREYAEELLAMAEKLEREAVTSPDIPVPNLPEQYESD